MQRNIDHRRPGSGLTVCSNILFSVELQPKVCEDFTITEKAPTYYGLLLVGNPY